jgi:uncharacterized membrane protein YcaP (DUF421 family)
LHENFQLCVMKKEQIYLWDIKRILFGQAPPEFLLEVFIRALIIYIASIVLMRFLGKRMNGQLTIVELAVIVTMGAAIAVPMQMPDRGIIQGFVVLACTLLFLRGINLVAFNNSRFEKIVQGEACMLIKDGVLNMEELRKTRISQQQIFEVLRAKKIFQLGKVKRMYLEACGIFSLYTEDHPRPGLPVFPPDDLSILDSQKKPANAPVVCINCGQEKEDATQSCINCGHTRWTNAIV